MKDVANGEGCAFVGGGSIWEFCVLSAQFCFKPRTALKIVFLKLKKKKKKRTFQNKPQNNEVNPYIH